ncbi:MAG: hypothetical protein ACXWB0_01645 [Sulfuricurvum sp.]
MKKILSIALILGATALMANPMQGGSMGNGSMGGGMMQKCQCDTNKLPPMMEKLGLNDKQKEQVAALRAEGKAFHNKQHEKMMAVLTPDQRKKFEANMSSMCPKSGSNMPAGGMGCKNCGPK